MVSYKKLKNILKCSSFVEIAMNSNNLFASDNKKSSGCCNFGKGDNNEKKKQDETKNSTQTPVQNPVQTPEIDSKKQQLIKECNDLLTNIKAIDFSYNITINEQDSIEQLTQLKDELTAKLAELNNKHKENPKEIPDQNPKDKEKHEENEVDKNKCNLDNSNKYTIENYFNLITSFWNYKEILTKIEKNDEFNRKKKECELEYNGIIKLKKEILKKDDNFKMGGSVAKVFKGTKMDYCFSWFTNIENYRNEYLKSLEDERKDKADIIIKCNDVIKKIQILNPTYNEKISETLSLIDLNKKLKSLNSKLESEIIEKAKKDANELKKYKNKVDDIDKFVSAISYSSKEIYKEYEKQRDKTTINIADINKKIEDFINYISNNVDKDYRIKENEKCLSYLQRCNLYLYNFLDSLGIDFREYRVYADDDLLFETTVSSYYFLKIFSYYITNDCYNIYKFYDAQENSK